ncbi:MAG: TIGR04282 family arsenosugar biosynthesis glycosyltransferase [Chitinophagaceae bacterium]
MTLIIFVKNLIYGRVKTRLAATIGNDKAFEIYQQLITYTCSIVKKLACDKIVYYSDYIDQDDEWQGTWKAIQRGEGLGERMLHAFKDAFDNGGGRTIIIGTDCFEITHEIIQQAFEKLIGCDVVIGPASDGGYYLLGMNKLYSQLFKDIAWSTGSVFKTTLSICRSHNLNCLLLPVLNDIDEEKDLLQTKQ